jgi:23S rRNA (cytosine1962-C5)-methyltransferase
MKDYQLLDSGNERRLERFGQFIFDRPEPKALWKKTLSQSEWQKAHAIYHRSEKGGGSWKFLKQVPKEWTITWEGLTFLIKPTGFKHMGLFPEFEDVWKWEQGILNASRKTDYQPHVLNLFGYTGAASLAAAAAGAKVTHVDGSREVITWARENAKRSRLEDKPIRWLIEDVLTYVKREVKRGTKYDGIIIDAPKFGRGDRGEVWKIEEDLPKLLDLCMQVLTPQPVFLILVSYATEYSSTVLRNILDQKMKSHNGIVEHGELTLQQQSNGFILPTAMYARWSK